MPPRKVHLKINQPVHLLDERGVVVVTLMLSQVDGLPEVLLDMRNDHTAYCWTHDAHRRIARAISKGASA